MEAKICLNMIVKDEKDVIVRCLDSVIPIIDEWVIVDTGSTDGTQKIIAEHLKDIPGKLFERPWKNWGETRTEALKLAQKEAVSNYLLLMDADDILEMAPDADFASLDQDLYYMWRGSKGYSYRRPQIVKKDLPWKYVGVTHEYLACDRPFSSETLEDVRYLTLSGGATAKDPKRKFWKNVELLEEGLKKEPKNDRYAFYLAESYRDAGEKGKSLEWYQKRIQMGGWQEETFWSMFQSALLLRDLGLPSSVVIESLLAAHRFRPHRPEPLYYLVDLYMAEENYTKAYEYLKMRAFIPQPDEKDSLFNMDWIEDYGLLFKLSICSYYVGHYEESLKACDQLLQIDDLPENWREQAKANRAFPLAKLKSR
jgi:glycosyltransferase involved in cell wall biosynthesis